MDGEDSVDTCYIGAQRSYNIGNHIVHIAVRTGLLFGYLSAWRFSGWRFPFVGEAEKEAVSLRASFDVVA